MKKIFPAVAFVVFASLMTGCSDSEERYIDLSSGKAIEVKKDDASGAMVNKETGEALYLYVDTKNHDTIYAKTGKVINGHVLKGGDEKYVFDEDEKLKVDADGSTKYKDGDYKVEVEKDGDIKIKDNNGKTKIDGKTGERKEKDN